MMMIEMSRSCRKKTRPTRVIRHRHPTTTRTFCRRRCRAKYAAIFSMMGFMGRLYHPFVQQVRLCDGIEDGRQNGIRGVLGGADEPDAGRDERVEVRVAGNAGDDVGNAADRLREAGDPVVDVVVARGGHDDRGAADAAGLEDVGLEFDSLK